MEVVDEIENVEQSLDGMGLGATFAFIRMRLCSLICDKMKLLGFNMGKLE
jgi:hypothetical protein